MNKTYVALDKALMILKVLKNLDEHKELDDKLRNTIYVSMIQLEQVGLEKVLGSKENLHKLVSQLEECGFKYEAKPQSGLGKLLNILNANQNDILSLKKNIENISNEFNKFTKKKAPLERELVYSIYGENKEISIKDIIWNNICFYKVDKMTDMEVTNYILLVKNIGVIVNNDRLRSYNEGDLNQETESFNNLI